MGYGLEFIAQSLGDATGDKSREDEILATLKVFAGPAYNPDHLIATESDDSSLLDVTPRSPQEWVAYFVMIVEAGGMPCSSACKMFQEIAEKYSHNDSPLASSLLATAELILSKREYERLKKKCNCPEKTGLFKRVRTGISTRIFGKAENSTTPISH